MPVIASNDSSIMIDLLVTAISNHSTITMQERNWILAYFVFLFNFAFNECEFKCNLISAAREQITIPFHLISSIIKS